jgi:hypothetical protein
MTLFLLMNASDLHLKCTRRFSHFIKSRFISISSIEPIFNGMSNELVMLLTEVFFGGCILWNLNLHELLVSKHLHILLAFPNTYFADLNPLGEFDN